MQRLYSIYLTKKISFLIVLFFIVTLPVILITIQKQQTIQQQAATATCQVLPLVIPVLVLGYFPPDPTNPQYIDPTETGWDATHYATYGIQQPLTLTQWHNEVDTMINGMIPEITDNTRYHGYKDSTAVPFLTWKVIDKKYFDQAVPKGVKDTEVGNPYRPNYAQILTQQNICNYVDTLGVKEVWMYSYHKDGYMSPDESRMSSKYGDISNSFPNGLNVDPSLILPVCNNSYVLYNFESLPNGSFANSIHNRMHQIEDTISYADNTYRQGPGLQSAFPNSLFWGNFALYTGEGSFNACGWTHVPPNTTTSYNYSTQTAVSSDCENWNPTTTLAKFSNVSCQNWGCTDQGFYKWWMQNNPGYNNGITYQNQPMRNWWEAMYNFNTFIAQGKTLLGGSSVGCVTSPTGTPVITTATTPSPTATPGPTQPTGNATSFSLAVCLQGLGNCGDSINASGGNPNPLHTTRDISLTIQNTANQSISTQSGTITYNASTKTFQGTIVVPNLSSGNYRVSVKTLGFISKQITQTISVNTGQTVSLPSLSLINGDIVGDNQLDISDYNALISCYGTKQSTPSCTLPPEAQAGADITDDGSINGFDYNLFVRELSAQKQL